MWTIFTQLTVRPLVAEAMPKKQQVSELSSGTGTVLAAHKSFSSFWVRATTRYTMLLMLLYLFITLLVPFNKRPCD